jgi:hypothetical protein
MGVSCVILSLVRLRSLLPLMEVMGVVLLILVMMTNAYIVLIACLYLGESSITGFSELMILITSSMAY